MTLKICYLYTINTDLRANGVTNALWKLLTMDKVEPKAHNIIAMTQFRTETGYTAISQVEAYWESLRGVRMMPKRSEIDPRGIETSLASIFVAEKVAASVARIRIAGAILNDTLGLYTVTLLLYYLKISGKGFFIFKTNLVSIELYICPMFVFGYAIYRWTLISSLLYHGKLMKWNAFFEQCKYFAEWFFSHSVYQ